ncbi:unnamed protein product [Prunus armeniaca]
MKTKLAFFCYKSIKLEALNVHTESMKQMEGKAMRQWYYFLVLFLALAFGPNICSGLPVMTKRFVRIVNLLDNKQLVYHCHSKDDDLGQRTLASQQEWEFKFHLDFETIFTCDFWHSNNHHAHFDVFYPSNKFVHRCGGAHCIWRAEEIGLSLYHIKTGLWEKSYDWEIYGKTL